MKSSFAGKWLLALSVVLLTPSLVHAYTGVGNTAGFLRGFSHPVGGLDYILAITSGRVCLFLP